MQILKINPTNPDPSAIQQTANVLKRGGIIIYPTDTAYGIGANALDEKSVRKVYEIKERNFSKPTHVVVKDWLMINDLCITNENAKKLFDKFMPGPLTLILPKKSHVPNVLTANLPTLGVRIPKNSITQLLSNYVDFPYTTPSANRNGFDASYSIAEVKKTLDLNKFDLILDAGNLPKVLPSTIVDLTSEVPQILRAGPILIS